MEKERVEGWKKRTFWPSSPHPVLKTPRTLMKTAFPRVHLSNVNKPQSENAIPELVVAKEAWSPFVVSMEHSGCQREADKDKGGQIDSYGFHLLIQDLINVADETNFQQSDTKFSFLLHHGRAIDHSLERQALRTPCWESVAGVEETDVAKVPFGRRELVPGDVRRAP
ncbi:hypothetical protein L484_008870 [Morus notabilis]|uniref:Uncharacterized protein n=1 Tax=Morus notabilis TaxID=981085 RepID=W9RFS2_9ROSA|nr:hypothetical protein L484_008870 [Morus notabilis]